MAGAIDGSLIPIIAPSENEESYVDRHSQHSINAMVVCGPNYEFFTQARDGRDRYMTAVSYATARFIKNGKWMVRVS